MVNTGHPRLAYRIGCKNDYITGVGHYRDGSGAVTLSDPVKPSQNLIRLYVNAFEEDFIVSNRIGLYACIFVIAVTVGAVTPVQSEETGRYSMSQVEGGFLRLDSVTGEVSLCRKQQEDWQCRAVSDDRKKLSSEIQELKEENKELKNRLADLEALSDLRSFKEKEGDIELPKKTDVDKVMKFVEDILQGIKDMAERLQDQKEPETSL